MQTRLGFFVLVYNISGGKPPIQTHSHSDGSSVLKTSFRKSLKKHNKACITQAFLIKNIFFILRKFLYNISMQQQRCLNTRGGDIETSRNW